MAMHSNVAIIIPSRIGSTRLPRKALAKISDKTLIEHVVLSLLSDEQNLYVATDSAEIADLVENVGAIAIMTEEDCPSGSDRVFQAFQRINARDKIEFIINVQGDMPFVEASAVAKIIAMLKEGKHDIVTSVVKVGADVASSKSNVKVLVDNSNNALYFSRAMVPHGGKEFLYHVGIYGYTKDALEKFVSLEQTEYEKAEKLEQLRALENGMKIGICYANEVPISVDTKEDLEKAREYFRTL